MGSGEGSNGFDVSGTSGASGASATGGTGGSGRSRSMGVVALLEREEGTEDNSD